MKTKKQFELNGFAQAMKGNELLINTTTDELVSVVIKDKKTRWDLYCKHVKITIDVIDDNDIDVVDKTSY
ncbi:MAG: hypothetical protein GY928_02210 [Colwellia sp.]|nr:hypothetical protein [Colwellia sp.]